MCVLVPDASARVLFYDYDYMLAADGNTRLSAIVCVCVRVCVFFEMGKEQQHECHVDERRVYACKHQQLRKQDGNETIANCKILPVPPVSIFHLSTCTIACTMRFLLPTPSSSRTHMCVWTGVYVCMITIHVFIRNCFLLLLVLLLLSTNKRGTTLCSGYIRILVRLARGERNPHVFCAQGVVKMFVRS